MAALGERTIDLVVTSPPYPMIRMWDSLFAELNPKIGAHLENGSGEAAFELMHQELDRVWRECFRVLKPGSFVCVNVGDAARTINGDFRMYPNHARVVSAMSTVGFTLLPDIIWRKPTNSPTKFMGSGMLPAGAYVTYEHEYVLVFRKGAKRAFAGEREKRRRRESAFFWEERNKWFSDVWTDLTGTAQDLGGRQNRARSAAFPFDLAFRLICMYSVYDDTLLDPFLGTGTSLAGAIAAGRNGVGVEIDPEFSGIIENSIEEAFSQSRARTGARLREHVEFVRARQTSGCIVSHWNREYGFPVMSSQEEGIRLYEPMRLTKTGPGRFEIDYGEAKMEDSFVPVVFSKSRGSGTNGTLW